MIIRDPKLKDTGELRIDAMLVNMATYKAAPGAERNSLYSKQNRSNLILPEGIFLQTNESRFKKFLFCL